MPLGQGHAECDLACSDQQYILALNAPEPSPHDIPAALLNRHAQLQDASPPRLQDLSDHVASTALPPAHPCQMPLRCNGMTVYRYNLGIGPPARVPR